MSAKDGTQRRGQYLLIAIMASLVAASAYLAVVITRFGIDWRASLSFVQDDGYCDPASEAVQKHCWGDFAGIRFDGLADTPTGPEALYPLVTRFIRLPFALLESAVGFRVAIAAWLITLLVAMVGPIVWATWRYPWLPRVGAILTCGLITMPTLVVLDRGNVIGLAVPAMLAVAIGVLRFRPWLTVVGIVAAAAVKPQFAVLALLLIALRWWRPLMWTALGLIVVTFGPPLVAGGRGLAGAFDWIGASMSWSQDHTVTETWPANASLAHAFTVVVDAVAAASGREYDPSSVAAFAQGGAVALVAATAVLVAWRGARISPQFLVAAVLCSASLTVPVAYAYYLAFAIPVCALYLAFGAPRPSHGAHGVLERPELLLLAVILSLTPLVVSATSPSYRDPGPVVIVESLVPVLAALAWAALLAQTCLQLALSRKDVADAIARS